VRVILDTNVFVSGVFFSGPPYRILEAWRGGKLQLVASQEILEEYQRVGETLAEQFAGVNLQPIIDLVTTNAEIFPNQVLPESLCEDPDDDKFIACALAGRCRVIISRKSLGSIREIQAGNSSRQKRMGGLRQAGPGPHPKDGFSLTLRSVFLAAAPRVSMRPKLRRRGLYIQQR